MSKSKMRLPPEGGEMSDADAIEHSRAKYARRGDANNVRADSDDEGEGVVSKETSDYKSKHTLDSDEEDEVKYKKLDMNKVEGQEETGVEFDGNTKITPFNMEEDLEEGHFDTDGNFIFNKKERNIKDAWLDNIDWAHIKKAAGDQWEKAEKDDDSSVRAMGDNELKSVYEKISILLQPNESIEKALRRLGKQKLSAAEERKRRWAAKKAGQAYQDESSAHVKELTGLADSLVSRGEMEAYQYTKAKLELLARQMDNKAIDQLDMFSDTPSASRKESAAGGAKVDDGVKWEYKFSEKADAKIHGPVSSEEMLKMQEDGKFEHGGWARKYGQQAFYTVARLDFELYT
ncbi:CD2 antigen cytoplasmic tail-binding protein 2 [Toxocara canis]|uniref:CD2 antigen cytoplasmic tail-binding protein 2 n=1 Tax=Toxocara canis TaxID=6265 RepID=A0A0B2V9Y2_TOXCA|nr:CD2 antigen cytoplasmic tail-binding protein 2 [Toxocara canis]